MVFDRTPDEIFNDVAKRALESFQTAVDSAKTIVTGVSDVIRSGDSTIRELDDALTGGRPRFGETPQETFMAIMDMLHGTLEDAREKQSAEVASVVQKAREILSRINEVEPAWRSGPLTTRTASDIFRAGLRDLRASNSLLKLAQGRGSIDDLKGLSDWADDLKGRLDHVSETAQAAVSPAAAAPAQKTQEAAPSKAKAKRTKKDTTPKQKGNPEDIAFALAVAEEIGDNKVKGWASEFAEGKISEKQWISRLTNHAAATRESLDDVYARATERMNKAADGK